jgi:hypothetical protein
MLRHQYWSWGLGFIAYVAKSYQQDVSQRSKLRRMLAWWFQDQLKRLGCSLIGCHTMPPRMILAELWGGVVGLAGGYSRSVRRTKRIRKQLG